MNRSGFTTIEVVIASALIVTLITGGAVGMRQMNLLNQVAATRTSHTEMRMRVLAAISGPGGCAAALGNAALPVPALPVIPPTKSESIPVTSIKDEMGIILENGKAAPGVPADGLVYWLALRFPTSTPDAQFSPGLGRATQTIRYPVQLEIRGERKNLKEMGGAQGDVVGNIPLSAEFDTSGKLTSCTTRHDDVDDLLAGSTRTIRDCLNIDGMPMPTAMGLICRVPVPFRPQVVKKYAGAIPTCASLTGGVWQDAAAAPNYNTTFPIDLSGRACKGTSYNATGWHAMSRAPVEWATIKIVKGSSKGMSAFLGGTAGTGLITIALFAGAIPIIGTVIFIILFILSLFNKCRNETFTFYAQVNGVGCI